mgnify:CR=1 FL=1
MTWPTNKAGTTHVDQGSDSIRLARPDIKQNIDNVNDIIDTFDITTPADGDTLEYNTASGKFENVNALSARSTVAVEFDTAFSDNQPNPGGFEVYTGGLTLTGSNATGVAVEASDSALGGDLIVFPAGTYNISLVKDEYSGVYGSTAYDTITTNFNSVGDDTTLFQGLTQTVSFYFRLYKLGETITFASETSVRIAYSANTEGGLDWQHPPLIITKIA